MGPVLVTTGWLITSLRISNSFLNNSVIHFCFLVSSENMSSYLLSLILMFVLVWYLLSTMHVSKCCMVSLTPHPMGQEVSEYKPLKSPFIPLIVRVRSQNNRFLLSLLKRGLARYSCSLNVL